MKRFARIVGMLTLLGLPSLALAAQQSFSDLPVNSPVYAAAEYLKANGILQGYEDGTFRPDRPVNRAEVMKAIVLQRVSMSDLEKTGSGTSFSDVKSDAWFAPYVEQAYVRLRIIDGPPKTRTFMPQRPVTRAEFLKMLLLAYDVDPLSSYGELTFPLADDVRSADEWYYPYARYALTSSMLTPKSGMLEPGKELTRGDIADMLYRFLLYREGKRTQTLLSVTENETLTALRLIETDALDGAEQAAARAILASRGALSSQPSDGAVKSSVKTAEAAMALVNARRAALADDKQKAIDQASTAWHLGAKARTFSSAFEALVTQIQSSATKIADVASAH